MADLRFHGKVAAVRTLHWLACRRPLRGAEPPPVVDPAELPDSPDVEIAPSRIPGAGLGAFARRAFAEGEVVAVYSGVRLSTLEALRTPDWRYLVGLGRNRDGARVWLDARPVPTMLARYVNHSFDERHRNLRAEVLPDAEQWVLRAARPIEAGEELYCDYGRLHWHCFDRDLLPAHRAVASG